MNNLNQKKIIRYLITQETLSESCSLKESHDQNKCESAHVCSYRTI